MNIFRPFEDVRQCVKVLDNKRLNKQILECWQIYNINKKLDEDPTAKVGYANHPVVKFYRDYPSFVLHYAYTACLEYWLRNNCTDHKLHKRIMHPYFIYTDFEQANLTTPPNFYCEGPKTDPNHKRIIGDEAYQLFQKKLIDKWNNDIANNRPPYWQKDEYLYHPFVIDFLKGSPEFYSK